MPTMTKAATVGSWGWWLGGALLVGLGFAVHKLLDFDVDFDLDWDNLPA